MRYFLFSWRWALNCCSSCPCPRMAFGCSGQSMPKPHSAPCSLWLIRPRLHALGLAMASPHGCGCQANRQLSFFWILQAQRLGHGYQAMGDWLQSLRMNVKVFSPLFPKLALSYWKHFRCMKCQTEWKIAEMRSFGCGSTCMAPALPNVCRTWR